jgi:hypothetical protein
MPQVVCWRDFRAVAAQVEHVVTVHPDEPPSREVADMLMYLVAFLDGARAAGFEVAAEEKLVEGHLSALERRR